MGLGRCCFELHYGTDFGDAITSFIDYHEVERENGSKIVPKCPIIQFDATPIQSHRSVPFNSFKRGGLVDHLRGRQDHVLNFFCVIFDLTLLHLYHICRVRKPSLSSH